MTATIIEDEVQDFTIEAFETDLPCENPEGCDNAAKWKLHTSCCKRIWLLCQDCLDSVIDGVAKNPEATIRCYKCAAWTTNGSIIGFVERI